MYNQNETNHLPDDRTHRRWPYKLGAALAGVVLTLALSSAPAHAAALTVDGTTCTLIDAITAANTDTAVGGCIAGSGADTITLLSNVTLTAVNNTMTGISGLGNNGLPLITSVITIEGNGFTISRASGSPNFRILQVEAGGNLTLNATTISGGVASGVAIIIGGGIYNGGTLTLNNSTLSGNHANSGGGIYNRDTATLNNSTVSGNAASTAGGIWSDNTLTLNNSTLSGNTASNSAGAIFNNGGAAVMVSNSTFSGNTTVFDGAGIVNNGTLTLSNSTLSGNTAGHWGGGILNRGTVSLASSLIAGNSAGSTGQEIYTFSFAGPVNSNNYNLIGHDGSAGSVGFTPSGSDIVPSQTLAAILKPTLANNGGPTLTDALVTGSPAVDAAPSGPATDQRGVARPQGVAFDIGAFELRHAPAATNDSYTTNEDTALTVPAPGVLGNDSDVDGNTLTAVLVSGPTHGALTLNADGSFTYTPAANFSGADSFTYQATDGPANSNVATVSLTVVSATSQISQLSAQVQALIASGALPSSNGQALINKLDSAQKQLDKGNINATITKLQDVITQVNGYIGSGMLTTAQGQPLIDAANAIIHSLQV